MSGQVLLPDFRDILFRQFLFEGIFSAVGYDVIGIPGGILYGILE